jgi:superfamily II DNA or RNA helicase
MKEMKLRKWQQEAKEAVEESWLHGTRCPTVVAPTGAGKTALAASLINDFPGRVLFTAHRDQLIEQTAEGFLRMVSDRSVGIIRAADNQIHADVIVASLQTLASGDRLHRYLEAAPPDLVIADEAHMSGAPIFAKVFSELGIQDRRVFGLGLSATLGRTTGTPLHELWDDPVYTMSLREAIEEDICVPPKGIRIHLPEGQSLLDGARDAAAWSPGLGEALEATDAPMIIAKAIRDHCKDRAVIGFAPGIRAAMVLAQACTQIGITAEVLTADTPSPVRKDFFAASEKGELHVLWSVDTISVGADLPWVSAVVVARDSGSRTWFVQAVGRGLRTYPGKSDCLVLDCSSTSKRLTLDTFFDFGRDEPCDGEDPGQGANSTGAKDLDDLASVAQVQVGRVEYSGFDFFDREVVWLTTLGGIRFIGAYQSIVFIAPDSEGTFSVGSVSNSVWKNTRAKRHARDVDLDSAVKLAELVAMQLDRAAPRKYGQQAKISSSAANWRKQSKPLTTGQETLLNGLNSGLVLRAADHIGVNINKINRASAATVIDVVAASAIMSRLGLDPTL